MLRRHDPTIGPSPYATEAYPYAEETVKEKAMTCTNMRRVACDKEIRTLCNCAASDGLGTGMAGYFGRGRDGAIRGHWLSFSLTIGWE